MKVIEFTVELHGNKEVSINGYPIRNRYAVSRVEEKILEKEVPLEFQHAIACELRALLAKIDYTITKTRVKQGELDADGKPRRGIVTSGAGGIPGTSIGPLPKGKLR